MNPRSAISDQWRLPQKWLFRFVAVYLFIYIFPFPLNYIIEGPWQALSSMLDPMMNHIAHNVLNMDVDVSSAPNGSGDTSYNYVQEFVFIVLAVVATIAWSVADGRRKNYNRLLYWIRVFVRYYLAFVLLEYGFGKFNNGQFPAPTLSRLMQPYGKSSPMGLAWTFLGYSKAFGVFMGLAECAGGLLLMFRRTALLGACIATTVVTNIVMINFCYDVPVKLFSMHLLLMCVFLLCTEGSRLLHFFIFNKAVAPADHSTVLRGRKLRIGRIVIKCILLIGFILISLLSLQQNIAYNSTAKPPLYGIYKVKVFSRNNDTIPALATDATRWNRFIIEWTGIATVETMTEKQQYFGFIPDTIHKTVTVYPYSDTAAKFHLNYRLADDMLYLYGHDRQDSLYISMQRVHEQQYLLINRGFRWVSEMPFNR